MKKFVFWHIFVAALLMTSNSQAQSLKDLFNKENIEKVVNSVTGKSTASRITCCRKQAVRLPLMPPKTN